MNKIFKTLIFIVYTFAIFALAFVIVACSDKGANFKDYTDNPKDENIAIVTQIIEKRTNKKQTKTDYEKSVYDIYFFVKKISSVELKNIYAYVAVETEEGIRYVQSTSPKSISASSSTLSTLSVTNSSNGFAVNEITDENGTIKQINRIPKNIYVKVVYDKVINKENIPCELNYKIKYDDINKESFDDYEKRNNIILNDVTQNIEVKNDYVSIKFLKIPNLNEDSTEDYNDYRISNLKIVKNNLPINVAISKIKLEVTAEATNFSQSDTEHFSKYIKLFVYDGSLPEDINYLREVSLADAYDVEKIYFNIEVELENKEIEYFRYYVLTSELSEK